MAGIFEEFAAQYGIQPKKPGASSIAGSKGLAGIAGGEKPQGAGLFENFAQQYGITGGRVDMTGTYRQWYTGQNLQGPANGWDTRFMETAQSQYVDSLERGDPLRRFERRDATGVVTWDGAKGRDGKVFGFGDVVADGEKVGNVYDDFDEHTANVMMGEWTIQDGTRKARLNNAGDYEKAWREEIEKIRRESTEQAEAAPRQRRLAEGAEERAEEENVFAQIAAGAGTGAAAGATGFAAGPVVGTVTTIGGAIFGGVGAWLNQDSMSYQIARAREQLDMVRENDNAMQQVSQTLAQVGGVASSFMNPLANLTQGVYDVTRSDFDASTGGEWYATTDTGERTASGAWQAAEFVARIGDGVLMFGNPVGVNVYMAQMGVGISGRAAGLLPGVGGWDQSRAQMDSVWTDENGKFDFGSASAGVANVTVEAVQLGGVKGLFSGLSGVPRWFGREKVAGPQTGSNVWNRMNLSSEQRKALKEGGRLEQLAGWKFVTDSTGEIVGKGKMSLSMLAPSEALQSLSAKAIARREAAYAKGAISSERLHQAAFELSVGERRVQTMLVNAFGEAQEEGLQQVLEPMSHQAAVDPEEVFRSAAAGFASGLGMGAGAVVQRPSADDRMFARAQIAGLMRRGKALERSEWDKMSELQRRAYVRSSFDMADSVVQGGWKKMAKDAQAGLEGDVVAANRVRDWFKKRSETRLQRGTKATDSSLTIVQLDEKRFRHDAIATSHTQLQADQRNRRRGIEEQIANIEGDPARNKRGELDRIAKELAAKPGDTALLERQAELVQMVAQLKQMRDLSRDHVERMIDDAVARIDAEFDKGTPQGQQRARDLIARLNDNLMQMYDPTDGPADKPTFTEPLDETAQLVLAKTVSRITTRHPEDSTASFQSFVPQVDAMFAEFKADGVAAAAVSTIKAMRGDYDGDKVHNLQQLVVDDQEYIDLRSGANILGAQVMPEVSTADNEMYLLDQVATLFNHPNGALRSLAAWVGADIEKNLREWYGGIIDDGVLEVVNDKVWRALKEGTDVRQVLLENMTLLASNELQAIGRGQIAFQGRKYTNQFNELGRMVGVALEDFQTRYAMHRDRPRKANPGTVVVAANAMSTDTQSRRGIAAATMAGDMVETIPGDQMFRMFQKLHYDLMNSTEKYIGFAGDNPDFEDLSRFYEQNGRDATGLKIEDIPANDEIVGRTMRRLRALSRDPAALRDLGVSDAPNVMALLANVETARFEYRENPATKRMEKYFTGDRVTLAQQMLYESLHAYERDNRDVLEGNTAMQATLNKYRPLVKPPAQGAKRQAAAERTFVMLFESVPLYNILGEPASQLGITLTTGQYFRRILNMDPRQRSAEHAALSRVGEYQGIAGKDKPQVPYRLQSVKDQEVTVFRTLVDSVHSAASVTVSQTRTGKTAGEVTGLYVDQHETFQKVYREVHQNVRLIMQRLMPKQTYTAEDVRNFVERNVEGLGDLVMQMIPDEAMPFTYKGQKDGKPYFAKWFYEMFAESDAATAEMRFRWNLWMDEWQAMSEGYDLDDPGGRKAITRDRIRSRFLRVMYDTLTDESGDTTVFEQLMDKGATATDLNSFMRWLNNESNLVGIEAPLIGWVDDTADFDATKTGSGWTQQKSTAQLLEDMRQLQGFSARLAGEVETGKRRREHDGNTVRGMMLALQEEQGTLPRGVAVHDEYRQQLAQFRQAVKNAGARELSYGPRAMVITTAVIAFGMYGQAHTKGSNPEFLAAVEQLEAVLGAFGYTVNLERLIADLTSHNEDSVAASPELIVRDGGRMTDRNGNQVDWTEPSAEELLTMMNDKPEHIDLVISMLAPQVMELGYDNRPQRQLLYGKGLDDLLKSTSSKDLYPANGRPGLTQAMQYLSGLEAKNRRRSKTSTNAVQRRVTEIVVARTSGLDHPASLSEIQDMTIQAYLDLAAVLQDVGRTQVGSNDVDPLDEVWREIQQATRTLSAANYFQVSSDSDLTSLSQKDMTALVKGAVTRKYADEITRLQDQAVAAEDPQVATELERMADALQASLDSDLNKVDAMISGDVHQQIINTYTYSAQEADATKAARRKAITEFVAHNGDTLIGMGAALPIMQKLMRYLYEYNRGQRTDGPQLTEDEWTTLGNHIISMEIQKLVSSGNPRNAPPPYPGKPEKGGFDRRRYFDPTWAYLADFLNPNSTDGLVEAAREEARVAGKLSTERSGGEIRNTILSTLYRDGSLGTWTSVIPIQSIEGYELMTGAASAPAIAMAGLITQRQGVISAATRRTFKVPPKDLDSRVDLTYADLNWRDDKPPVNAPPANPYERMVEIVTPDNRTLERPLSQINKRFARKITMTYEDPTEGQKTIDVTTHTRFSTEWGPTIDTPNMPQDFRVIDIEQLLVGAKQFALDRVGNDADRIRDFLSEVSFDIEFLHPETQPATEDYYNNVWFEGTVFSSAGDSSSSLLYSLWFGSGGINALVQQAALDTRKKGWAGIAAYAKPGKNKVLAAEAMASDDFAAMLLEKTKIVMNTDLGGEVKYLDHDFYNAVFKLMKMKHFVDGTVDGQKVRLTAEQVIEGQAKYGPGYWTADGTEVSDARLWIPSDQVLTSMLAGTSEIGFGGVPTELHTRLTTQLADVPPYRGINEAMRFQARDVNWGTRLTDTKVANTLRMFENRTNLSLDPQQRSKFRRKWDTFKFHRAQAQEERRRERHIGFDPAKNLDTAKQTADRWMSTEDLTVKIPNAPWMELPAQATLAQNQRALNDYIAWQTGKAGQPLTGWVFQLDGTAANAEAGLLTAENFGRINTMPGDPIIVDMASFERMYPDDPARASKEARGWLRTMAQRNLAIMPLTSTGPNRLVPEMASYLTEELGYVRYQDNPRILIPDVMVGRQFLNAAAARGSLLNRQGITIRKQRVLALLKDRNVTENTMLVPIRENVVNRMQTVQLAQSLLPLNVSSRFGVPQTREHLNMMLRHLEGIASDDAMKKKLVERMVDDRGNPQPGQADFLEAFDRLMERIYRAVDNDTTLPQYGEKFGTGDLIPLMSDRGELLLYRHGYEFPYSNLEDQLQENVDGEPRPRMVAVYSGKPLPNATTYTGTVTGTKDRQKYGLQLDMDIPVNVFGMKAIVEVNGMKWLQAPLGDQFLEPSVPVLGRGDGAVWIDGFGSLHDALSKQATDGVVTNFRNAFAFFGAEHLMQDVATFFGTDTRGALEILRTVERAPNKRTVNETKELQDLMTGSNAHLNLAARLVPMLQSAGVTGDWLQNIAQDSTAAFVARAMLLYLTTEGSSLDSVRYSSGFHIDTKTEPDAQTQRMDELFTRMFDKTEVGSTVREEMFRRFNDRLGKSETGLDSFFMDQSWNLIGTNANGEEIEMILDFGEVHVSDDNIELNVQAQNRRAKQGTGVHSAWVTEFGLGGETFPDRKVLDEFDRIVSREFQEVPQDRAAQEELWDKLTHIDARTGEGKISNPVTNGAGSVWRRRNHAENEYARMAMQRHTAYLKDIDYDQESLREDKEEILTLRTEVAQAMNLHENEAGVVDFLLRQMMYQPAAMPGQTDYDDIFNAEATIDALKTMLEDVKDGRFPTYRAFGAKMVPESVLNLLFNASRRGGFTQWAPYRVEGDPETKVGADYGEWIAAAFGQSFNADQEVDEITRLDMDGVLLSYDAKLREMGVGLDITLDPELQEKFLDPKTNELLTVTTSPIQRAAIMETVILPRIAVGYEGLIRGVGTAQTAEGIAAQKRGYVSHSRKRVAEFKRKNKIRPTKPTPGRDYVEHGSKMLESQADMHSLSRILIALRHGTTMLNPGLYVSMIPERAFRTYLNGMANVLTGESTSSRVGGIASRIGLSIYTPEQVDGFNRLYRRMADDNTFAGMIIKELMYEQPQGDSGAGKFVRGVEKFAAVGNKWQDPTWGIPQRLLAQHYVESILRQIAARPISNVMTVEQVVATLQQDPGYFAKHHPEMHKLASNAVIDMRGLRNTIFSLAAKSLYEPLTRSSSPTINFAGTLIKLPLMYVNFTANMLTTITGMQGVSQMASAFFDGRQTAGTLMNRIWKKLSGQPFDVENDVRYDLESTMDAYTIANAFIRGGVTQTGLFAIALLSGGIFSGEDDEARRRRRLAQAQNAPFVADPRRLEADFRNKDMFFLDWLPEELKSFFTVAPGNEAQESRAAVQLSWILKPFLSPILGMEKFIQTGDWDWITYGFMDAVGSLPLFNKQMWDDAVRSADELTALAAEQQDLATPESTRNTMYLLISAFSVYERMLFENMFVNSIYTGFDTWDRDPTKLVLRDSDGDIQRNLDFTPRENDLALETFVDENGNVKEGYQNRDEWDKLMAYYSENNFSAMAALSLFTGFQKDLNRYQMPVKTRDIELPQITSDEAKLLVSTALERAWAEAGGAPQHLSLQEITKNISSEAAAAGNWDVYNQVDAIASQLYEDPDFNPQWSAMSVLNGKGDEVLTTNGAATILDGLRKGTLSLDHPSMRGISIPFEMRQQIQDEFMADVMQEGVDMGLTNTQASYRAQRLLKGPVDDNTVVGFADILWDDRIPYGNKRPYKQLNTTYVRGPDGWPWATGFKRGSVLQSIGLPIRPTVGMSGATTADNRLNTVDLSAAINTGLRGLVPYHESEKVPTDKEIGDAIVDAIEKIKLDKDSFTPFDNNKSSGRFYRGGGYRRFPRYSRGGGGGGGYSGGGSPTIYFSRQPYLAGGTNIYGDSTRNVFWDTVNIRRTRIRRERVSSQRGRLNQWQ